MKKPNKFNETNRFNTNPTLTIVLFLLVAFTVLIFSVEIFLRLIGEKTGLDLPAKKYVDNFEKLELYTPTPFSTDSEGVFKADPDYSWKDGRYGDGVSINSDGFRSSEFNNSSSDKKKILFLGDSFVWGASAKPLKNCFVDIIQSRGYLTFNTGIPGTGPTQYAYLAEKFIPLLKPDFAVVMLYLGNDIQNMSDPMLPYKNLWYITNAGWLYAFDEHGNHLSLSESYHRYYYQYYVPYNLKNKIKHIMMNTVVGKRLWRFLKAMKESKDESEKQHFMKYTEDSLDRIKKAANKHGVRFFLFLIPPHPKLETTINSVRNSLLLLPEFNPFVPTFLTIDDYMELPDDHFNNSGHLKYANFIIGVLEN